MIDVVFVDKDILCIFYEVGMSIILNNVFF